MSVFSVIRFHGSEFRSMREKFSAPDCEICTLVSADKNLLRSGFHGIVQQLLHTVIAIVVEIRSGTVSQDIMAVITDSYLGLGRPQISSGSAHRI